MTCEACKDRLVKSELQIKSLERTGAGEGNRTLV